MTIFNRIINTLHASEKPLDVVDLALLLKEDADNVGAALLELKRAGRVHENHRHRWRLTNEERTRLRERQDQPGAPPKVPRDGIHEAVDCSDKLTAVLRTAFQPKCRHCTDWKRLLPDTANDPEGGWCERFSDYRAHYESHECHSELPLEPTNAELDAIEAEEHSPTCDSNFKDGECDCDRDDLNGRKQPTCGDCGRLLKHPHGCPGEPPNPCLGWCEIWETWITRDTSVSEAWGSPTVGTSECPHFATTANSVNALEDDDSDGSSPPPKSSDCKEEEDGVQDGNADWEEHNEPNVLRCRHCQGTGWEMENDSGRSDGCDRPTNGLRIEQVARELVEVERRRQKLLEELRRLV